MKFKPTPLIWVAFTVASLLTVVVYATLWSEKWYVEMLSILGICSCALAAVALKLSNFRFWAVAGIAFGVLIGQWWFVESAATQILWSVRGFAP